MFYGIYINCLCIINIIIISNIIITIIITINITINNKSLDALKLKPRAN